MYGKRTQLPHKKVQDKSHIQFCRSSSEHAETSTEMQAGLKAQAEEIPGYLWTVAKRDMSGK